MIFKKYIPMKKPIFFRLIIYILIVILFRVEYLVVAFSLGFGSGSGHMWMELILYGVFFLIERFFILGFPSFHKPGKKIFRTENCIFPHTYILHITSYLFLLGGIEIKNFAS